MYKLSLENFEGPIDVLLRMVREKKMSISDLSLASIAEEYITYIQNIEEKDIQSISAFLVVAATLVLIKSKSLLPGIELPPEDEAEITDLKERISLYKSLQEVVLEIQKTKRKPLVSGGGVRLSGAVFSPDQALTLEAVRNAAFASLDALHKELDKKLPIKRVSRSVALADIFDEIKGYVMQKQEFVFSSFISKISERFNISRETHGYRHTIAASFLAILEMARLGEIDIEQSENYKPITVKPFKG